MRQSTDGYAWSKGPDFLTVMPEWVQLKVPNTEPGFWAPDIAFINGWWHLYYAISSGGSQHSCIALAVNQRLDSNDPLFAWKDAGPVTCSTDALPYNCIDPHVFVNPNDNTVWMNWSDAKAPFSSHPTSSRSMLLPANTSQWLTHVVFCFLSPSHLLTTCLGALIGTAFTLSSCRVFP